MSVSDRRPPQSVDGPTANTRLKATEDRHIHTHTQNLTSICCHPWERAGTQWGHRGTSDCSRPFYPGRRCTSMWRWTWGRRDGRNSPAWCPEPLKLQTQFHLYNSKLIMSHQNGLDVILHYSMMCGCTLWHIYGLIQPNGRLIINHNSSTWTDCTFNHFIDLLMDVFGRYWFLNCFCGAPKLLL